MFDSPFVRRVAVSMQLLELPFEHRNWSVGKDFERIRRYNPLGRVPALVLDDGEVLIESAAILDFLDERVGAKRALLPRDGAARRHGLQLMALASGAADKTVAQRAFRPSDKRHAPWLERCRAQVDGALQELDRACARVVADQWLLGAQLQQPDITLSCVHAFISDALSLPADCYPALAALRQRTDALPAFRDTYLPLDPPAA
jgi:glutathione S-transferase